MGQFALGLRSLLIKAAIFVVMAALLAWALGGTLWPRPHIIDHAPIHAGGNQWWWRLSVGGSDQRPMRWTLVRGADAADQRGPQQLFPSNQDALVFADVAGPVVRGDVVAFAGLIQDGERSAWRIYVIDAAGQSHVEHLMPDRLAVEQQLARFAGGLPIQDEQTIVQQRTAVLDPR